MAVRSEGAKCINYWSRYKALTSHLATKSDWVQKWPFLLRKSIYTDPASLTDLPTLLQKSSETEPPFLQITVWFSLSPCYLHPFWPLILTLYRECCLCILLFHKVISSALLCSVGIKNKAIPLTARVGLTVARRQGSHIFYTICSQPWSC
jgi:hypothetical protein